MLLECYASNTHTLLTGVFLKYFSDGKRSSHVSQATVDWLLVFVIFHWEMLRCQVSQATFTVTNWSGWSRIGKLLD